MIKKIFLFITSIIFLNSFVYANNCSKFFPMPIGDGLVVVVPISKGLTTKPDLDCDGVPDSIDTDIDGDGVKNSIDKFPRDKTESKDFDNDGIGDNADLDDDNDGLLDTFENKYYPYLSSKNIDTDGNGIDDVFEDIDGDYLDSLQEQKYNTNPLLADTDGDGFTDYEEIYQYKTSPILIDTDGDTLSDGFEIIFNNGMNGSNDPANLDPLNVDSDNDGILDGDELIKQTIWKEELPNNISNQINSVQLLARGDQRKNFKIEINQNNNIGFFKDSNLSFSFKTNNKIKEVHLNLVLKENIQEDEKEDFLSKTDNLLFYEKNLDFWIPSAQKVDYIVRYINGFEAKNGEENGNLMMTIINTDYEDIVNKNTSKQNLRTKSLSTSTKSQTQYLTQEVSFMVVKDESFISDIISQETKICIPKEQINKNTDIVFVLDSSGSMSSNDPSNIRVTASKDFLNAFALAQGDKIGDRGAVVDFDGSAELYQSLTTDISLLEDALNRIDSNGNTNIGAGVDLAINELLSADFFDKNHKVIILLTDGSGSYDSSLTQRAKDNNIKILTIGLSSGADNSLLQSIAKETGGIFKQIDTADELLEVFKNFEKTLGDDGSDSDGDGLTDCAEYLGMHLLDGTVIETDPNNPDTDGDGLIDGSEIQKINLPEEELEERATKILDAYIQEYNIVDDSAFKNVIKYGFYSMISNPSKKDSDGDTISDSDEFRFSTNPLKKDSDGDTLSDNDEINLYETDPTNFDTDGDSLSDGEEIRRKSEGFDPIAYNYKSNWKTRVEYIGELAKGGVFGDFANIDTPPELYGQILGGFFPPTDVRDVIANVFKGEWIAAGLSAVAILPIIGDATGAGARISKFISKFPSSRYDVIHLLNKHFDDSYWVVKYLPSLPPKVGKWALKPFKRGKELEVTIAENIPGNALLGNFPKIDVWDKYTGIATSIKTLDLNAKTYIKASAFKHKIKVYTKDLKSFMGKTGKSQSTGETVTIAKNKILKRELVVGIPNELTKEFKDIASKISSDENIKIIFKVTQ